MRAWVQADFGLKKSYGFDTRCRWILLDNCSCLGLESVFMVWSLPGHHRHINEDTYRHKCLDSDTKASRQLEAIIAQHLVIVRNDKHRHTCVAEGIRPLSCTGATRQRETRVFYRIHKAYLSGLPGIGIRPASSPVRAVAAAYSYIRIKINKLCDRGMQINDPDYVIDIVVQTSEVDHKSNCSVPPTCVWRKRRCRTVWFLIYVRIAHHSNKEKCR